MRAKWLIPLLMVGVLSCKKSEEVTQPPPVREDVYVTALSLLGVGDDSMIHSFHYGIIDGIPYGEFPNIWIRGLRVPTDSMEWEDWGLIFYMSDYPVLSPGDSCDMRFRIPTIEGDTVETHAAVRMLDTLSMRISVDSSRLYISWNNIPDSRDYLAMIDASCSLGDSVYYRDTTVFTRDTFLVFERSWLCPDDTVGVLLYISLVAAGSPWIGEPGNFTGIPGRYIPMSFDFEDIYIRPDSVIVNRVNPERNRLMEILRLINHRVAGGKS